MQKVGLIGCLIIALLSANELELKYVEELPQEPLSENVPINFGGTIEFESRYVWNGIDLSGGAVFQPSAWIAWKDFSLFLWTNMPLQNQMGLGGKIDEVDLGIEYNHLFEHLSFDIGFTYFVFPQTPKKEVMTPDSSVTLVPSLSYEASLALGTRFKIANISLPIYFNLVHGSLYLGPIVTIGYTFEGVLRPEVTAKLGIGGKNFNASQFGVGIVGKGSLNDFTTSLSLTSDFSGKLGNLLTIKGWVSYAVLLDDSVQSFVGDGYKNFWGGINFAFGF